ncbi:MAG: transcription-repair coupling factor [Candidatus Wallbacteria bacterium]|nr:transcription-repair coupling factor [Candidatus Wallbacteria bacterium]
MLTDLLSLLRSTRFFRELAAALQAGETSVALAGLQGSASRLLAATLAQDRPILFLLDDEEAVRAAAQDLSTVLEPDRLLPFPGPDVLEHEVLPLGWYEISHRLKVLEALAEARPVVVPATPLAALSLTMAPGTFRKARRPLQVGAVVDRDMLLGHLDALGYVRAPRVETMGEFSVRGGIVDIYGTLSTRPFRVELFGDTVESLRLFDPTTQRSVGPLQSATIAPVREVLPHPAPGFLTNVQLDEKSAALLQSMKAGKLPKGVERLLAHLPHEASLLPVHFPSASLVVDATSRLARDVARDIAEKAYGEQAWSELETVISGLARVRVGPGAEAAHVFSVACKTLPEYLGNQDRMLSDLRERGEQAFTRVVAASTPGGRQRLAEVLDEAGLEVVPRAGSVTAVALVMAELEQGFELPEEKLILVTENDLWRDRRAKERDPAAASSGPETDGMKFSHFSEITEGSLVVHYEHGVGRFLGLKELRVDGVQQDYLELEYDRGDKLFVPVNQLDRVQRYVGVSDEGSARLSKLGSARWSQAKHRVRKEVEELARKLLELYAKREMVHGFAFSPDNTWMQELEGLFPFTETPDQLRAIAEVKTDMRKERPMDRLLCGDVGYGKTEVAVRASFKAIQDGKQVAVLVPTTILAEQHFHTFKTRMAAFPVNIGCLSRLRTPQQQKQLVADAKIGKVDVLIGTHRILSKDVKFKDLGLLVVDEEQRFGVTHKEKIKGFKESVDVLTMTATPIPRTLNLAMSGARDISVITTPPPGRLPIKTYVLEYDEQLVKGAVERELERGGQIYYVYNRIDSMDVASAWLKKLVPKARIRCGHGQMDRQELEDLMNDFYAAKFDVLISTTIIESGLDVPNVNTIVMHRADAFGLAQLYQLRGRVGRTSRQAYAYLFYPSKSSLSGMAFERLKALEEHTDLGSGFKIAMRDLELRGAGNILGAEQHGFIDAVGFELYTRLLREAVADLKGQPQEAPRELTKLELQIDCYIPAGYIADIDSRITHYRRLAEVTSEDELQANIQELKDRYGKPPEKLDTLFRLMRVKMRATDSGVAGMQQKEGRVFFKFPEGAGYQVPGAAVAPAPKPAPTVTATGRVVAPPPEPPAPPPPDPDRAASFMEWLAHVRRTAGPAFRVEDGSTFSIFLGPRKNLDVLRLLEDLFRIERPASERRLAAPPPPPKSLNLKARRL